MTVDQVPEHLGSVPAPSWRVHDRGRVSHWMVQGLAVCGEPGTGWRTVAGTAHCPSCQPADAVELVGA